MSKVEYATFKYCNNPMIRLKFVDERLVSRENLNYFSNRPDINCVYDFNLSELESFILSRRIAGGRPDRNKIYFDGKSLTPYQEMKKYGGADNDDYCWLDFDDTDLTYEKAFGGILL